ncbi:unnamed protein product [Symbiodinium sp. CCMP2456]|nr:unnamed protein product [Symbiodinium sp. CCMP2456]
MSALWSRQVEPLIGKFGRTDAVPSFAKKKTISNPTNFISFSCRELVPAKPVCRKASILLCATAAVPRHCLSKIMEVDDRIVSRIYSNLDIARARFVLAHEKHIQHGGIARWVDVEVDEVDLGTGLVENNDTPKLNAKWEQWLGVVQLGSNRHVGEAHYTKVHSLSLPDAKKFKVFVPALRDLEGLLRKAEIPVSIAALDLTASPAPPDAFLWEYPAAVAPHIQLILPRSMDGEAGVVDYDGVWDARSLAMAACRLAGPRAPEISAEEISRLENGIQKLRDLIFEMLFLQEVPLQDVGRKKAWWSRWLHRVPQQVRSLVFFSKRSDDVV